MAWKVATLSALLVAVSFAGCIGAADEGEKVDASTTGDATISDSPEGRGRIVAFEETNQTEEGVGGVDHHHDYWQGRERVTIFETESMMGPVASYNAPGYEATARFQPPQGTFIYEATESVEFTLSNPQRHACEGEFTFGGNFICTDPNVPRTDDPSGGPDGLKLRYKHAATITWLDAGDVVWGQPIIIKITNPIQTDMPHATSSVWDFQVLSPNKQDTTLTFTAKADVIRGGVDIPLWPGHPNFYADTHSRVIADRPATSCDSPVEGGCALAGDTSAVVADRLVSYGTKSLHVWVNITAVTANNPALAPTNWFLYHQNATQRDNVTNVFDVEDHPADLMQHYWILPVDDNGMDSPYADGSRWNFQLGGALNTDVISCYGGCADWTATYTMVVHATDVALPAADYEMYCLRDDYCPSADEA